MKKVLSLFLVAIMVTLSLGTLSAMALSVETVDYKATFVAQEAIHNNVVVTDNDDDVTTDTYGSDSNRMSYALYKFDISNFELPIFSANFTVGLRSTPGGTKTAKYNFYIVDSAKWSGWDGSAINATGFNAGTTAAAQLVINSGDSGNKTVALNDTAIQAINTAITDGDENVILCVQQYDKTTGTSRGAYNVYYTNKDGEKYMDLYMPKLEAVAETGNILYDTELSIKKGVKIEADSEAKVENITTEPVIKSTALNGSSEDDVQLNFSKSSHYILERIDLTGCDLDNMTGATLKMQVEKIKKNYPDIKIYGVTGGLTWAKGTLLDVANIDTTAFATTAGEIADFNGLDYEAGSDYSSGSGAILFYKTIELSLNNAGIEYLKNCKEAGYAVIALQWTRSDKVDDNHSILSVASVSANKRPAIVLEYASDAAVAATGVVAKAEEVKINNAEITYVRPVIASYDAEGVLIDVKWGIGVPVEAGTYDADDSVAKYPVAYADTVADTAKVKVFLWKADNAKSFDVTPAADANELTFSAN